MTSKTIPVDHSERMDRKYARVRHLYDITRKYFLFGRDDALERLLVANPKSVLEIGCGTGRNLEIIARRVPEAEIHGIDISAEMLRTAAKRTTSFGNVTVERADAEKLDPERIFGLRQYDAVLMSYSLSMIPDRQAAMSKALKAVSPGGRLVIVDFGDFEGYGRLGPFMTGMLAAADAPPIKDLDALVMRMISGRSQFETEFSRSMRGYYRTATVSRRARS